MDCDLQDPPEILPQFLAKWREGFQVVYAIRKKRKEWFGKRFAYWTFYRLMSSISEIIHPARLRRFLHHGPLRRQLT